MTIMTVSRDAGGSVINMGPWDTLEGQNPLPTGATSAQEDVTTDGNGGRVVTSEVPTPRQEIIARLRADPILKAQVIDSFEARGITDKQVMLDALVTKFGETI